MAGLSTWLVSTRLEYCSRVIYVESVINQDGPCLPVCPYPGLRLKRRHDQKLPSIRSQANRRHHRRRDEGHKELKLFSRRQNCRKDERTANCQDIAEDSVVITIDMEKIRERLRRTGHGTKRTLQESACKIVNAGQGIAQDAMQLVKDLRTSVALQSNARVVVVRKSSLLFGVRALFWSCIVVVIGRLLATAARQYWWGWNEGTWSKSTKSVVPDKSLGGRGVTLRTRSPLDGAKSSRSEKDIIKPRKNQVQVKQEVHLPGWWPRSDAPPLAPSAPSGARRNQAQAQAKGLVQEMIQKRIGGQDFMEDDILELRTLCRDTGAKVSFDTANSRDSFYRIAVNYVLSATSKLGTGLSSLALGNEDAAKFIAGLAGHIGLDANRAATMVDAAVAARTRAGFLQAWALFKQKSVGECEEELLKLIRIHSSFRPDANSPEIELVAHGLTAYLPEEQRKRLLEMYVACGGSDTIWVAEEALGLVSAYI